MMMPCDIFYDTEWGIIPNGKGEAKSFEIMDDFQNQAVMV
jgi:hypothetical protein